MALRGERIVPLWPLARFDVPGHPLDPPDADAPPLPQVYVRLGEVNLQYLPLGDTGILHSEPEKEDAKDRFLALFRPSEPRPKGREWRVVTVQGPEAFAAAGATRVFPEGLPPMGTAGIRAMLVEKIGPLRKTLLRRDTEEGERISNPFVDKVARLSEGLPLYVKYVVEDMHRGLYHDLDAGVALPPGLDSYHAELIRRPGIGDLHQVLALLAATLAVAEEPLLLPSLADLLHRRGNLVPEGDPGHTLVRKALGLIQSMIRGARTPADREGRDEQGYLLYHHSLAQHMAQSTECSHTVDSARGELAKQAKTVRTGPLAAYLFRRGIGHLLETGEPKAALALLTDFDYLMDRLRTLPDPDAVEGLDADWRAVLRQTPALDQETRLWASFFREREHILRRGDWRWPGDKILLQLAVEHADDSPVTRVAEQWLRDGNCDLVWWRNPQRPARAMSDPCLHVLAGHDAKISGALAGSARRVLSWAPDETLKLWDWRTGQCVVNLDGHTERPNGAALLPNGRLLSWASDETLRIWDAADGQCVKTVAHPGLASARVLPNGNILSWDEYRQRICLWDGYSAEPFAVSASRGTGLEGPVVLSDNRILAADPDGDLHSWNGDDGSYLGIARGSGKAIDRIAPLGDRRVLCLSGREHRVWDFGANGKSCRLDFHGIFSLGLLALHDGRILGWDNLLDARLFIFNRGTGKVDRTLRGHLAAVEGALELPGERILSWSRDATLRVWDSTDGTLIRTFAGHTDCVRGARVMSGGDGLLSWSDDCTLRIWDTHSATLHAILTGHTGPVEEGILLGDGPDQRILSYSYWDADLRVWDAQQSRFPATLARHSAEVTGVKSLDDERVLTWSKDGTLRLWHRETGAAINVLARHRGRRPGTRAPVMAVDCLGDRTILSAADDDRNLRLWNGQTGQRTYILRAPEPGPEEEPVWSAPFCDHRFLVLSEDRILTWHGKNLWLWQRQQPTARGFPELKRESACAWVVPTCISTTCGSSTLTSV